MNLSSNKDWNIKIFKNFFLNFYKNSNFYCFQKARLFRLLNNSRKLTDGGFWSIEEKRFKNTQNESFISIYDDEIRQEKRFL